MTADLVEEATELHTSNVSLTQRELAALSPLFSMQIFGVQYPILVFEMRQRSTYSHCINQNRNEAEEAQERKDVTLKTSGAKITLTGAVDT